MIFSSIKAMAFVDLVILGLVITMLLASWKFGMFTRGKLPRSGRFLIMAGAMLTGLFYVADFVSMTLLPGLIGEADATAWMRFLHLEFRWPLSIISLTLICFGVVLGARQRQRVEAQIHQAEQQVSDAQDRIVESEIQFRALVEQTPDAVYCFEFQPPIAVGTKIEEQIARSHDAVLVECNRVFASAVFDSPPSEMIGMRFGEMDSSKHTESHNRLFRDFIEAGYRLVDYELKYERPDGAPRALQLSWSGVMRNGQLVRFWGSEKDILETSKTKAVLASRLHFQQFAADLSSRLLTAPDDKAERVLMQCLEQIGRYVGAERARIACFDSSGQRFARQYVWKQYGETHADILTPAKFPKIWPRMLRGEPFSVSDAGALSLAARTDAKSLGELGVQSFACVPLVVAEEVVGACLFGRVTERHEWSDQEMEDLRVLSDLLANKLIQIEGRQSLNDALGRLQDAKTRLEAENRLLREEISTPHGFDELIGESDALTRCLRQVERVADTSTPVLLQGETGTGKELVAQAIHDRSACKDGPMVKVNCAALPGNLIESELFGHEKGAYTGATSTRPGRFEMAHGGTLFLDEIGAMPFDLQSKLLRALQCGEFERLGSEETRSVTVRVVAATNLNLQEAVDAGAFRPDLFYRIGTFPITLPPLRERGSDIELLAEHFVQKHAGSLHKEVNAISASMLDQLGRYDWPGNVRELEGIVQRALISSNGPILDLAEPLHADFAVRESANSSHFTESTDLRTVEREHITRVLEQTDWVVGGDTGAALRLGLPASTLRSKMKKLGIGRPA